MPYLVFLLRIVGVGVFSKPLKQAPCAHLESSRKEQLKHAPRTYFWRLGPKHTRKAKASFDERPNFAQGGVNFLFWGVFQRPRQFTLLATGLFWGLLQRAGQFN